jgi:hypothetical protein
MDLVETIRKFHLEKKVSTLFIAISSIKFCEQLGWMIGDGASANDVAVRTVCHELDPEEKQLKPKQVRILYVLFSFSFASEY